MELPIMVKSVAEYYASEFRKLGFNARALTNGWDDLCYVVLIWRSAEKPYAKSTIYSKGSSLYEGLITARLFS